MVEEVSRWYGVTGDALVCVHCNRTAAKEGVLPRPVCEVVWRVWVWLCGDRCGIGIFVFVLRSLEPITCLLCKRLSVRPWARSNSTINADIVSLSVTLHCAPSHKYQTFCRFPTCLQHLSPCCNQKRPARPFNACPERRPADFRPQRMLLRFRPTRQTERARRKSRSRHHNHNRHLRNEMHRPRREIALKQLLSRRRDNEQCRVLPSTASRICKMYSHCSHSANPKWTTASWA